MSEKQNSVLLAYNVDDSQCHQHYKYGSARGGSGTMQVPHLAHDRALEILELIVVSSEALGKITARRQAALDGFEFAARS